MPLFRSGSDLMLLQSFWQSGLAGSTSTRTLTVPSATAVLVEPVLLPLTEVEVYRPVTIETPAKRSATLDVLIWVAITGSQWPVVSVFVHWLVANAPHVVTVFTCTAAFEAGRFAADVKL